LLLVAGISFTFGYKQDMDRKGKDGKDYSTSHHIMNGLKWMGIVLAILTLIAVMIAVVFDMSVWEIFFFRGRLYQCDWTDSYSINRCTIKLNN